MPSEPETLRATRIATGVVVFALSVVAIVQLTAAAIARVPAGGLTISVLLPAGLEYTREPLPQALATALGWSFVLATSAFALASIGGVTCGLITALAPIRTVRAVGWLLATVGVALPSFLWAMLLQLVVVTYYVRTHTLPFPSGGAGLDQHLVLPTIALAARPFAYVVRVTVAAVHDQRHAPYVQVARGKGLSETAIVLRHLLPVMRPTLAAGMGYAARVTVSSLVIVEYVFNWPGAGSAFIQSVALGKFALAAAIAVAFITLLTAAGTLAHAIAGRARSVLAA